jgi:hypothetical protein
VRRLLSVATMVMLAGCSTPGTGSSPSGLATDTPQPSPTASEAAPTPSPTPAPGTIVVDGLAKSTVDSLAVRARAGTSGTQLGTINTGQFGFVVAGPVSADGYAWYQLSAVGLPPNAGCEAPRRTTPFNCPDWFGWVAAGKSGGPAWLEPMTQSCPTSPMNVEALVEGPASGPRTALERLACYRSSQIRIRGWFPTIPPDAGLGGTCGANPPSLFWLECGFLNYNGLVASESAGFRGTALQLSINPASGVVMPPRGRWVEVVGHLDDAAARDCRPSGGGEQDLIEAVLGCRGQFVAESATAVAGTY